MDLETNNFCFKKFYVRPVAVEKKNEMKILNFEALLGSVQVEVGTFLLETPGVEPQRWGKNENLA